MAFTYQDTDKHICRSKEDVLAIINDVQNLGGSFGERHEKQTRIDWIKGKLLSGELRPFYLATGEVESEHMTKRVNGQHTSLMFLGLTEEEWARVPWPITLFIERYKCDTLMDLSILFEQFDSKVSVRNSEDNIGPHLAHYPSLAAVLKDRKLGVKLVKGLDWYHNKIEGQTAARTSDFTVIHRSHDVHEFMKLAGVFLSTVKTPEMLHDPILAAIYHTTRQEKSDAQDFWIEVSMGKAHHDADSIQYKLAEFFEMCHIKSCSWPAKVASQFKGHHPGDNDVFATALRAFKAWREHRKVAEIFTSARNRKPATLAQEFWPLAALSEAA